MRVAVISDIHDNIWKLAGALRGVEGADLLICCGDLCSPFVIHQIGRGFPNPVHIVFGNNDGDQFRISANARSYRHVKIHGEFLRIDCGGKRIAAVHYDTLARPLAGAGEFDAVCFGHNHIYELGRAGKTLLINPGAVMGAAFAPDGSAVDVASTYVVYDTASNVATGYEIDSTTNKPSVVSSTENSSSKPSPIVGA